MMTLIFHGYLKELFPDGRLTVGASSAAEAIAALEGRPGFRREDGDLHSITLPGFPCRDAIFETTEETEVHVLPALEGEGGKNGAFLQIVIGAALIYFSGGIAAGMTSAFGTAVSAGSVAMSGAMMVLGGILALLMPQPTINKEDTPRSNYLPANQNTVAIGTPIPLLVGKRRVWGHFLSFDIDALDRASVTTSQTNGATGVTQGDLDAAGATQTTVHEPSQ